MTCALLLLFSKKEQHLGLEIYSGLLYGHFGVNSVFNIKLTALNVSYRHY